MVWTCFTPMTLEAHWLGSAQTLHGGSEKNLLNNGFVIIHGIFKFEHL
jgi:hypothetical protein